MQTMTFCVPCLFGLEGLVGDELKRLNLSNVRVEDRRVFFDGDFAAMAKANLCCRMGERVMILLSQFEAKSFEDLYQGMKKIPLEDFVPKDGAFPVKGYSLDSQLHSVPDCQAIVKKAAVDRLGREIWAFVAARDGRDVSDPVFDHERPLRNFPRHFGREPAQAGLPRKRKSRAAA